MTPAQALEIVGGLTHTSKMPCPSYSLPASACKVGSALAKIPDTICSKCYAKRGHYPFPNVQNKMNQRLSALVRPEWVDAMVLLISPYNVFRWHDSGDLQDYHHLKKIVEVCRRTPQTLHWMPTHERRLMCKWFRYNDSLPENLIVRLSSTYFDRPASTLKGLIETTSGSHKHEEPIGFACPAPSQGGACGECRACWDKSIPHVSYKAH